MADQEKRIEPIDLTEILKDFENKWVVLSDDYSRVLASGDSLDDVLERSHLGIVMNVLSFHASFSPSC